MRRWICEIDLHIVYWLALCSPVVVLPSPWWLLALGLLSQGRLLMRSMDLRSFGESAVPYLLVNECFVLLTCLLLLGVWSFVRWSLA